MEQRLPNELQRTYRELAAQRRSTIAFLVGVVSTFSDQELAKQETRREIIKGILQAADRKLILPFREELAVLEDQLGDTAALLGTAQTDRTSIATLHEQIARRERRFFMNDPVLQNKFENGLSLLHDVARRKVEQSSGSGKERR